MYDLVIIGAGPAGIAASIYAKRAGLNVVILEKAGVGGQILLTPEIENYPGFSHISGMELMKKMEDQAKGIGVEIILTEVTEIMSQNPFIIKTKKEDFLAKSVIIASGATHKKLDVPGEKEFTGRGVSYCATCDGFFFRNKDVAIVGGGNKAIEEALYLANIAKKVYLIHRRDCLRAEKINQDRFFAAENGEVVWNSVIEKIEGDQKVEKILLLNTQTKESTYLPVDGVFVAIGVKELTDFAPVKKERGFIITDEMTLETSVPGIFAAGDCRVKELRQVVTAVSEGALAAVAAKKYIKKYF